MVSMRMLSLLIRIVCGGIGVSARSACRGVSRTTPVIGGGEATIPATGAGEAIGVILITDGMTRGTVMVTCIGQVRFTTRARQSVRVPGTQVVLRHLRAPDIAHVRVLRPDRVREGS